MGGKFSTYKTSGGCIPGEKMPKYMQQEKSVKTYCRTEGNERAGGRERQPQFVGCSAIYTLVRAYLGDTVTSLRQRAPYGGQMACYFSGVRIKECLFYQFLLNKYFSFSWSITAESRRDDDAA